MKEALAVRDEVLKVPKLWPVHRRVIDLGEDAVPQGKPDSAGGCISSPHPVFPTMGPTGFDAGPSKSFIVALSLHAAHRFDLTFWSKRMNLRLGDCDADCARTQSSGRKTYPGSVSLTLLDLPRPEVLIRDPIRMDRRYSPSKQTVRQETSKRYQKALLSASE